MSRVYMGLENEFITFNREQLSEDFKDHFESFTQSLPDTFWRRFPTSIRTGTGHAYYVDQNELELVTPPVEVRPGFATELVDLLMIGRERITNWASANGRTLTGYSMHWNVSRPDVSCSVWFPLLKPAFALFAQTPRSMGVRCSDKHDRYEIRGDSMSNESQLRSTALLLGAYHLSTQHLVDQCALGTMSASVSALAASAGYSRSRSVRADYYSPSYYAREDKHISIKAQTYLKRLYSYLRPVARQLGTPSEVSDLDDLVEGVTDLEIDKKNLYRRVSMSGYGVYRPSPAAERVGVVIPAPAPRELPLAGKIHGFFPNHAVEMGLVGLGWSGVCTSNIHCESTLDDFESVVRANDKTLPPAQPPFTIISPRKKLKTALFPSRGKK